MAEFGFVQNNCDFLLEQKSSPGARQHWQSIRLEAKKIPQNPMDEPRLASPQLDLTVLQCQNISKKTPKKRILTS